MFVCSKLEVAITSPSFVALYSFWYLRYLNILPEAVCCCFTRTTLNVYCYFCGVLFEKNEYIPSFILNGCCVSELLGHLCPYRNVWPEAIYCCFTRTKMFTELFTC